MKSILPKISRRSFIISSAAAGSGLALGLQLPFGPKVVRAADGSPEIGAARGSRVVCTRTCLASAAGITVAIASETTAGRSTD